MEERVREDSSSTSWPMSAELRRRRRELRRNCARERRCRGLVSISDPLEVALSKFVPVLERLEYELSVDDFEGGYLRCVDV